MTAVVKSRLVQGNEAVVEGALVAGIRFYAAYPITPANEISSILAQRLPALGGVFIQMEDEIASIAAVMGASLGGAKAATATSGPGFSLMQENIGYAITAEIPCVIINVQRLGPSTGVPTSPSQGDVMQARWGSHGDHPVIALCPSSVVQCYQLTIRAFNLSEKYRIPVILLMDEAVAHARERIEDFPTEEIVERMKPGVPPEWYLPYANVETYVPPLAKVGVGYRYHVTGLLHDEAGFPTQRLDEINPWFKRMFSKIEDNLDDILVVEEENVEGAEVILISYGISYRSARHAMKLAQEKGMAVGLVNLLTLWPFPETKVRQLAEQVKSLIVVEMNRGQILREVERAAAGRAEVKGANRSDGELVDPSYILSVLEE